MTKKENETELLTQLKAQTSQVATLRAELEAANKQVSALQTALNEVTPLRRHVARFLRYRLRVLDGQISSLIARKNKYRPSAVSEPGESTTLEQLLELARKNDRRNFTAYNKLPKQPVLPLYRFAKKVLRKSLGMVREAVR